MVIGRNNQHTEGDMRVREKDISIGFVKNGMDRVVLSSNVMTSKLRQLSYYTQCYERMKRTR